MDFETTTPQILLGTTSTGIANELIEIKFTIFLKEILIS